MLTQYCSSFLQPKEPVLTPDVQPVSSSPVSNVSPSFARLSKLELQNFDGNLLHFHSFWDSFSSVVGKNDFLNQVTKFNYLKSLLADEPCTVIQGLSLTLDNYKSAVEFLKERFADTQVILSENMDALLSLKPASPSHDILCLRKTYDAVDIHSRNLVPLDINIDNYGPMLIFTSKQASRRL